jgi:hypothetical protein
MDEEVDGDASAGASPGIGAAINCIPSLVNVEGSDTKIDNAGLHRSKDAGAGAFTPYHDRLSYATDDIVAGQELFISYGSNYFETRASMYGHLPSDSDNLRADRLIAKYKNLPLEETSQELQRDVWNLVTSLKQWSETANRMNIALPDNFEEIDYVAEVGTAKRYYNRSIRDVDWLKKNGKCIDNLRAGLSTIPQAGRGAFATRFIPMGGLVAPAPLIHFEKKRLIMYDVDEVSEDQVVRNVSAPRHFQLLLNYCFGHANSTLLLSPYGTFTSLINHSSKNPNARIEWAENMRHADWCQDSIDVFENESHSGLMFDFIALRDIQEGEEVLIDYGKEWDDAWNEHVRKWTPPEGSEQYMPAYELNNDVDLTIPTIHETQFSDNILAYIYDEYREMSGVSSGEHQFYPCRVLDRYPVDGETVYMVELFLIQDDEDMGMTLVDYENVVLFAVPRDAFTFSDTPYSRDHSLVSSFRHEMMVPDDMFPEAWMNKK